MKLSNYFDPDIEDVVTKVLVNFGDAQVFVKGKYPLFMISPSSNTSDPGVYEVSVTLGDDNPKP